MQSTIESFSKTGVVHIIMLICVCKYIEFYICILYIRSVSEVACKGEVFPVLISKLFNDTVERELHATLNFFTFELFFFCGENLPD